MTPTVRLTAVVLARNEAAHLPECLDTLSWADELLVVDDCSTDATAEIARSRGARVVQRHLESFSAQRNFALSQVHTPWVLFVDADERVSPALRAEILAAIATTEQAGYWIPRQNLFWGRWVRHAGWGPDYQLRLFQVSKGRYDPMRLAHEIVELEGPSARLQHPLIHYNYASFRQFLQKQHRYARLEAERLWHLGQRTCWRNYLLQPLREFNRRFFTWQGYKDGPLGLLLSLCMAYFEWEKYRQMATLERDPSTAMREAFQRLPEATLDFSVVIVSYNVAHLLASAIASVQKDLSAAGSGEIIVVDNASHDGSAELVRREFPDVHLIENKTNVGFGRAANQGMLASRGRWVVILNPDASVQPGFFSGVRAYLQEQAGVGMVGPRLVQPDGSTQSSCRRFPSFSIALRESTPLQWWFGESAALRRFYCRDLPEQKIAEVDWLVGACLVVRREVLREVGGFDPRFFMYFEETDWCHRIRAAGWRIMYFPQVAVLHFRSQSANQDFIARALNFHHSRHKFWQKYWGTGRALLLRFGIGILFAVDLLLSVLKLALQPRNDILRRDTNVMAHVAVWYLTGFPGRGRRLS